MVGKDLEYQRHSGGNQRSVRTDFDEEVNRLGNAFIVVGNVGHLGDDSGTELADRCGIGELSGHQADALH